MKSLTVRVREENSALIGTFLSGFLIGNRVHVLRVAKKSPHGSAGLMRNQNCGRDPPGGATCGSLKMRTFGNRLSWPDNLVGQGGTTVVSWGSYELQVWGKEPQGNSRTKLGSSICA